MPKDYSKTLNLPATTFEMRANLPVREEAKFKEWLDNGLYADLIKHNEGKPLFTFHDGPPYANGDIHTGHALNKILKDFIVRYKNMSGFLTHYIHGWDTHGLPIENKVKDAKKVDRNIIGDLAYRELCREFALGFFSSMKSQMQRLGVLGDWDRSYLTLKPEFESEQIRVFGKMFGKGCIYKGLKPVYWCAAHETALAEAEIEYSDDECDSIYVKFPLKDDKGLLSRYTGGTLDNVSVVIWTTTTWTLPANLAVCVGPEFEYSVVKVTEGEKSGEVYILASELAAGVLKIAGVSGYDVLTKIKGSEMEYMKCLHPFFDRESLVIVGDHVSLDSGTGCVHTAPGHGVEDFNICKNYKEIPVIVPVDSKGFMTEDAGKYKGLKTSQANVAILEDIKASGALLATEKIVHQYPHCWRCKTPILFRATEQWFCSVDDFKEDALKAVKGVKWYPPWGEVRIENMVKDRADWCISRQRVWGVPIPVFYCEKCGHYEVNADYIEKIAVLFGKEGSDAWYKYTPEEIVGSKMICTECGNDTWRKETDTMDVWFDSGSSYASVLKNNPNQSFPADLYLEGNDQYRGWFQSSLLTSVATRCVAPYKMVITHGMIIDEERRKMSKSLGNGIDPMVVIKEYGSDVLRLWVSSVDYTTDVKISSEILKQLVEIYRKIRNTARILLANLGTPENDFDPARDIVPYKELEEIDRWAMGRLNDLVVKVTESYENYQFHLIYHDLHNFCTIDMSKLYIDIAKDRLYVEKRDSKTRRAVQTVMYRVIHALTRLIAPILCFTADEIWQQLSLLPGDDKRNVNFNDMPKSDPEIAGGVYKVKWEQIFLIRDDVTKALENARAAKVIGKSLDAKVIIEDDSSENISALKVVAKLLNAVFIVSAVEIVKSIEGEASVGEYSGLKIAVRAADGVKCARCWTYTTEPVDAGEETVICPRCAAILGDNV